VKQYLNQTPVRHLSTEGLRALLAALTRYPLTKAEKLQIVNLRPQSKVELHVVRLFRERTRPATPRSGLTIHVSLCACVRACVRARMRVGRL
jgi:hypothetical protein